MKIAVISDTHANLPALEAVLGTINEEGCDMIFHLGDAVAIGPNPAECVDLLQATPNLKCILGNHELYYLDGLPTPQPSWMSDGEVLHQIWTHKQLGDHWKPIIAQWPLVFEEEFAGVKVIFAHYGLTSSQDDFRGVTPNPKAIDLDEVFKAHQAEIVCFGHDHSTRDIQGKTRYINPGSLGCSQGALARYIIAKFEAHTYHIQHHAVPYDDDVLYEAFEERLVPERALIYKAFFGGRFRIRVNKIDAQS